MEFDLTLKQDGEKVTGTLAGGPGGDAAKIEEGTVKAGTLTFKVTRDFGQGRPIVTMYTGKDALDGWKAETVGDVGVIVCVAAGNNSANNDTTLFYPASYRLSNMIVVAATDQNDALASFSDARSRRTNQMA